MKRFFLLLALPLALVACQKGHPISVKVSPDFQSTEGESGTFIYEKIAVFPFLTALYPSDDPDQVAPATMEKYFVEELNKRTDYHFVSPNTVRYAVDQNGWGAEYDAFVKAYPRSDKPDKAFLTKLAKTMQVDAFLIPVVDTWQKDEVDVHENATAATYVGATITVLDAVKKPGKVLFRAVDEDYEEGARSETSSRQLISTAGRVRSDPGAKAYAAPGFEDVAPRVVNSLVQSLPLR